MRRVAAGLTLALLLIAPAVAEAAPPRNDNYLSSLRINGAGGSLPREFSDSVDTTEATVQADTFDPNRDGVAFGGGKPEPTSCPSAAGIGRTVWYDFSPPTAGGVDLSASGFDTVIAVYEWNARTAQLGRLVACGNGSAGPAEELLLQPELRARGNYTVQVGGVNGAGGPLALGFTWFPDRDGDGVLDEQPDKCPRIRGIGAFGGCPPLVRGSATITVSNLPGAVQVQQLQVARVLRGTRVEVRCRRCGKRVRVKARKDGALRVRGFDGRRIAAGDRVSLRLTRPPTGRGRYRFGAYGKTITWRITGSGLAASQVTCTEPGGRKTTRCP